MVGIDDMAFYVPDYYLDLKDLATNRGIEYEKLSKGLGVLKSAVPGTNEDAISMAANAALQLILQNQLDPRSIGRIYVGTESAVDGAKPIASYVTGLLESYFQDSYSENCFRQCDAIDMTFACIGAVDAMLTTVDWCAAGTGRTGIVIASDYAKYELESSGEYTQGAGAVAVLIKSDPRLMTIQHQHIGVACKNEHDFHKPVRTYTKETFIKEILEKLSVDVQTVDPDKIRQLAIDNLVGKGEKELGIHKSTPLFDGQFSNQCYADRLKEAYHYYTASSGHKLHDWKRVVFHLPYAFHGKRIFNELFFLESANNEAFRTELQQLQPDFDNLPYVQQVKLVAQTPSYKNYVAQYMGNGHKASSEIGNIYTASIFMALISTLETDYAGTEIPDHAIIGFCAYGSGSKAKVFEGSLVPGWKDVVKKWGLFSRLENRTALTFADYEAIHNGTKTIRAEKGFYQDSITPENFARHYAFQ